MHLTFSMYSSLFFSEEKKYTGGKNNPTEIGCYQLDFRSQEIHLMLLYHHPTILRQKWEVTQDQNVTKQQKHPLIAKRDSCSYFSVLLCWGVCWISDPSLLTDAATVDIVSASSLLLWCSAIKASSCFLLRRNSSLRISCLLISDHNCFQ